MKNGYNDNFDPWSSLGLATAMMLNRLHCQAQLIGGVEQKKEEANGDRKPSDKDESDAEREREYVETRLREIDAFERRYKKRTT